MTQVSVVIAVYDDIRYLAATLDSIREQTFNDWECIIVDDGSSDAVYREIEDMVADDRRFRVLRNAQNRGLAHALNLGWRAAQAPLIARIDADDTCMPERLQQQADFLDAHPEIDVVGSSAIIFNPLTQTEKILWMCETHEKIIQNFFRLTPLLHPCVVMRRAFLERTGGYDERFRWGAQDFVLWASGAGHARYHNLQMPLIRYCRAGAPSWRRIAAGAAARWLGGLRMRRPLAGFYSACRLIGYALAVKLGLRS